jgi:hypothetical protein
VRAVVTGRRAHDIAQPQVVDAGAAHLAQASQRRGVGNRAERAIDAVTRTLERRTLVRRAEADQVVHASGPAQRSALDQRTVMNGAAGHQTAHAVTQHGQALDRHRPSVVQTLHQLREDAAIGRHAQAAVVVEMDRGVAQIARQRLAVIMACALPLQVVHAQAMQQHEQSRRDAGRARTHGETIEQQCLTGLAKRHRDRQRVVGGRQIVAEHAVERRDNGFALGTRRQRRVRCGQGRTQQPQQDLGTAAHQLRDARTVL